MVTSQDEMTEAMQEVTHLNTPDNAVVRHLQREVANALVLYVNYKHYHWQVAGPLFRDLHLMFDEFAKEVEESLDEFAERLRMIGQDPMLPLDRISKAAVVTSARIHGDVRLMMEEADRNAILVIDGLRQAARAADDENDPGSVDLFSKVVRAHEKHEWYFRELLKRSDGLVGAAPSMPASRR